MTKRDEALFLAGALVGALCYHFGWVTGRMIKGLLRQ